MNLASELEEALERVTTSRIVEIRENGRRIAGLDEAHYEVRPGNKPLLHLWSGERSLVRRVSRVVEATSDILRLEVERFGPKGLGRLEITRRERPRRQSRITREGFAERFSQLLQKQFPDERVESLTVAPDLEHSLSGSYARGWTRRGQQAWAVLGAAHSESAATIDAALTFGLIWLDWLRTRAVAPVIAGLRLVLPAETARATAYRLNVLGKDVSVELYEWRVDEPRAWRIDPADAGNIDTWLTPRRETERILGQAAQADAAIRALAPSAIDSIVVPGTRQIAWRYHGLEFARWVRGNVFFGLGRKRYELGEKWSELERLVAELAEHRFPDGNRRHPLFRAARERWLETVVRAEITRIDARLDPAQVYCQVPAVAGRNRGVIDLLGVSRDGGRLAVIELKADEDPQLVLQAVDYWLRVRWHLRQGDFQRYGYFPGTPLQAADPLLFLVAPDLRFHPATSTVIRHLSPEIPICRVGVNEDWRHGLRVIERVWRSQPRGAAG